MITEEDIAKIRQLILSDDEANVIIGVNIAKHSLNMTADELKMLVTMNDCTVFIDQWRRNRGFKLMAFSVLFFGKSPFAAYNSYCEKIKPRIYKLMYDL